MENEVFFYERPDEFLFDNKHFGQQINIQHEIERFAKEAGRNYEISYEYLDSVCYEPETNGKHPDTEFITLTIPKVVNEGDYIPLEISALLICSLEEYDSIPFSKILEVCDSLARGSMLLGHFKIDQFKTLSCCIDIFAQKSIGKEFHMEYNWYRI